MTRTKRPKEYDHETFVLGDGLTAFCHTENTRYGFRHLAVLLREGEVITRAKACYYNRTWEAYRYESVLLSLIYRARDKEGVITPVEFDAAHTVIKNYKEPSPFTAQSALLALADVLAGGDLAQANAMKKSALSTIPGIDFPDDWDSLPEDEKSRRLSLAQQEVSHE